MDSSKPQIVVLGHASAFGKVLQEMGEVCDIVVFNYGQFELGEPFAIPPALILCETPPDDISVIELAQSLRMNYQAHPVFIVTQNREKFNRPDLQKNGFTDAFLLPNDNVIFESTVKRAVAKASMGGLKVFRSVQLVDIEAGTQLGFDLYIHLPANNKTVKVLASRDALDSEKIDRLSRHNINSALVTENQLPDFYRYSADRLRAIGKNDAISETEKQERREQAVRTLLSGIFGQQSGAETIDSGRGIMKDCNEIVKSYITGAGENTWYDRFLKISGTSGGSYSHAESVASLASMLAIGLGLPDIQDIGLAGLLHDIGISDLPPEVAGKTESERTPAENEIYKKHPLLSVEMIKNKKMIVSEKVVKIILQHHERYDGKGYPAGLSGTKVCIEAQILRFADRIDKLTEVVPGRPRITPLEAANILLKENTTAPGQAEFSSDLVKRIQNLLVKEPEGTHG